MIALPLKNYTMNSSSIVSLAKSQNPATILGNNPDPTILAGYKKQRDIIISQLNTAAIGDISWNTGPSTSLYMTRPLSRGSVQINGTSILTDPLIDFGAANDPTDIEMLLAIYLKNRELMSTKDLAILGPIETSPAPGLTDHEEIKKALKASLTPTNAHMCCTNAMMKRADGGVVDPENRVYGTKRLSVVDASVWPIVVASGPMGSVYAGAEKVGSHFR